MKAKSLFLPLLLATLFGMSGCAIGIRNATPPSLATNPSGIYTLSAQAILKNKSVDHSSTNAFIVIDGETHPMEASNLGNGYFDYDYTMPSNRDTAQFYYILEYKLGSKNGSPKARIKQSKVNQFKLIDRMSITLDANRAPVGTQLTVLGRGFSTNDKVFVGGIQADTRFVSGSVLQFILPSMTPDRNYAVEVRGRSIENAGTLKVDPGMPISVIPNQLTLNSGQGQTLAFAITSPAPTGGLFLSVTTDIPSSIIMPEVIIPEGSRTVSVTVQGGKKGNGNLFIQGPGMPELVIPVSVR